VHPQKLDFGLIKKGEKRRRTCLLRNTGDAPLVIESIRASCAECMVDTQPTMALDPGEEFELPITYLATAVPGKYTAHVTFHTNDSVEPLQRIFLDVEIAERGATPRVEIEPETLDLGIVIAGERVEWGLKVRNAGGGELRLEDIVSSPFISVGNRPGGSLAPGEEQRLSLTVAGAPAGVFRGHIAVATNDPERRTVTVPVSGYIATREQVNRLLRGVHVTALRSEAEPRELRAVLVTNNDESPVWLSAAEAEGGPLEVPPGESVGVAIPAGMDAETTFVLHLALSRTTGPSRTSERRD
jgi:hypothetical protein